MSTKGNSFWSLKVRRPHAGIHLIIKRHPRRFGYAICLLVAIGLTAISALVFNDSLTPIPDSHLFHWQITVHKSEITSVVTGANNFMACASIDNVPTELHEIRGWPLGYYYYQPGFSDSCFNQGSTITVAPLPMLADMAAYFVFVSVAWWEFGRMQRGMAAKT